MANRKCFLNEKEVRIAEGICLKIPSVGEILRNEDAYYGIVSALTSSPYQYMVQLDDIGIDYSKIDEWQLFCIIFLSFSNQEVFYRTKLMELKHALCKYHNNSENYIVCKKEIEKTKTCIDEIGFNLVFKDLKLTGVLDNKVIGFNSCTRNDSPDIVLYNPATKMEINKIIYYDLVESLRKINAFEKINYKPGNEHMKEYTLKKERKRQERNAKKPQEPYLEKIIVGLVNNSDFPYDYDSCMTLTIYNFNQSYKQITHKLMFDSTMLGIYTGNINPSKMTDKSCLSWI